MDLGFFWRSRMTLAMWIAIPLALMGGVGGGALAYHNRSQKSLDTCRQIATELPELRQQIEAARKLLHAFISLPEGAADPAEILRGRVNKAAKISEFTIDSLVIGTDVTAGSAPAAGSQLLSPVFRLTLSGEGTYLAITRFIAELEGRRNLTAVDSLAFSVVRTRPEPFYNVKITLLCRMVTDPAGS